MTGQSSTTTRGAVDRDLFCRLLEQYLCGAAAAQGLRGNLASVVASIERGGSSGSTMDPNLAMLRLIGWREGRHDDFDPLHRPAYHLNGLRAAEQRFRALPPKHQATAIAHYVLASRVHETLRASFGEMAGIVLHRHRAKAAKARARDVGISGAKAQAELEALRASLLPLERAIATAQAALDAPLVLPELGPEPERPYVELVLRRPLVEAVLRPWRAAHRAWREPLNRAVREHDSRRHTAEQAMAAAEEAAAPLRAASARLCAQLAAIAEAASSADDEQQLVDACRRRLTETDKAELVKAAEADCRAAHRAWRETGKSAAQAWLDRETAA